MNTQEMEGLMNKYWAWLKDKTSIEQIDSNWVEITTPYLDRHNDHMQIYVRKNADKYELTDDGYIIRDLLISGCSIESQKRQTMLKITLAGFGVSLSDNKSLYVFASAEDFSIKKHSLVQAMLAVNDLFFTTSSHAENLFLDDVTKWLDVSDIRYTPRANFTGKSGLPHLFDFVIPKSKEKGERILQAESNPRRDKIESLIFKWQDIKETRGGNSELFVLMNDIEKPIDSMFTKALQNYQIKHVDWLKKELLRKELAA
jgi:hypothetical protein